jgi:hypothetical protein
MCRCASGKPGKPASCRGPSTGYSHPPCRHRSSHSPQPFRTCCQSSAASRQTCSTAPSAAARAGATGCFLRRLPALVPAEQRPSAASTASRGPSIGHAVQPTAKGLSATAAASSSEWAEVYSEGSITQRTFSGPSASVATSSRPAPNRYPPDRPSSTFEIPLLPT